MHSLTFDKPVYSDAGLTTEVSGPFSVGSTTELPAGIHFSNVKYIGQGKNAFGDLLWTVTFTYPDHVVTVGESILSKDAGISKDKGATYV